MNFYNFNFLNIFFLSFSIIALLIVYYLEYFLGIEPCKLCIYQRFPYFIIILISLSSILIKNQKFKKITLFFYTLIFSISLIISLHHFGVENSWWGSFTSCEASVKNFSNENNLKQYLLNKDYISCSNVSFNFLGVSLAGYNIILSFILFIISLISFNKIKN